MRYKNQFLLLLLLPLFTFSVKAQKLDSLLRVLKKYSVQDTNRVIMLNNVAKEYVNNNPNKSIAYADSVFVLAQKLNHKAWQANACNIKAANYFHRGEYLLALTWSLKALSLSEESGNQRRIAQSQDNIAVAKRALGDYKQSLIYFQKALDNFTHSNQKDGIALALYNISIIHSEQSDYPKAFEYAQKALKINEQLKNKAGIAKNLDIIGAVYYYLQDYTKAKDCFQQAVSIDEEIGNKREMTSLLGNLSNIYEALSEYQKAVNCRLRTLSIMEQFKILQNKTHNLASLAYDYLHLSDYVKALEYGEQAKNLLEQSTAKSAGEELSILGEIYLEIPDSIFTKKGIDPSNRYDKALEFLNEAMKMSKETGELNMQRITWERISSVYEKEKDYLNALDAYKNSISLHDSIINDKKKKEILQRELQYIYDKKEDSLKLQQQITVSEADRLLARSTFVYSFASVAHSKSLVVSSFLWLFIIRESESTSYCAYIKVV